MTEHTTVFPYRKGDIVFYRLRARDNPSDPRKQWAGKIIKIFESSVPFS